MKFNKTFSYVEETNNHIHQKKKEKEEETKN